MKLKSTVWMMIVTTLILGLRCQDKSDDVCGRISSASFGAATSGNLNIRFALSQQTMYPPSFALWIEDPARDSAVTIYSTCKAVHGSWGDGANRPEALPVWDGVHKREVIKEDFFDAITSATPQGKAFDVYYQVPAYFRQKTVTLYIETNASYDNNEWFTGKTKNQSSVNGQPSVVWKCTFVTYDTVKTIGSFSIAGSGSQNGDDNLIHAITDSMTTAKDIIQNPTVGYLP